MSKDKSNSEAVDHDCEFKLCSKRNGDSLQGTKAAKKCFEELLTVERIN